MPRKVRRQNDFFNSISAYRIFGMQNEYAEIKDNAQYPGKRTRGRN